MMIQEYLKEELQTLIPELIWTVDYRTANDNTGTVYSTGGFPQGRYEGQVRRPTYQVYISSSDWDMAKVAAQKAYEQLHNEQNLEVLADGERFFVYLITAASEPLRLGVENGVMDYSLNFDVELKKEVI
ncbi:hypothetical protein GLV94_02935 [Virgibacillus halodenitrificans]|uniref:phage tail terminator protein n=1 Tax=Virgibacillus halodenitrificans TaxID=1482 RepID=UPI00136B8A02|nr:minor capsid protein [Virgibacillus halodenitrificans]MYL44588.1 hypothetical protein [Virgibacillus halodenitrificans]